MDIAQQVRGVGPGHGGLTGHQRSWDFTCCDLPQATSEPQAFLCSLCPHQNVFWASLITLDSHLYATVANSNPGRAK